MKIRRNFYLIYFQKQQNDQNELKPMANRLTAETRRSQFRQKSVSLCETRPRLMRAMSAPIRPSPLAEAQEKLSANIQSAAKKRLRRKKIAPIEIEPFSLKMVQHQPYASRLMAQKSFDERPSTAKSVLGSRAVKATKPPKPTIQPRAKSAVNGCEIVTLVSLLSPGASDSEKEDYVNGSIDSTNEKVIPSLRKVGKSGKIN